MELPLIDADDVNSLALECFDPIVTNPEPLPPPILYVPPRIDQDRYQADIPNCNADGERSDASRPGAKKAFSSYNDDKDKRREVTDFLVRARNLLEPIKPPNAKYWSHEDVLAIPLESDCIYLEYLADHNYNAEEAYFSLCCQLGYGKDAPGTVQVTGRIDRVPVSMAFMDCKIQVAMTDGRNVTKFGVFSQSKTASSAEQPEEEEAEEISAGAGTGTGFDGKQRMFSAVVNTSPPAGGTTGIGRHRYLGGGGSGGGGGGGGSNQLLNLAKSPIASAASSPTAVAIPAPCALQPQGPSVQPAHMTVPTTTTGSSRPSRDKANNEKLELRRAWKSVYSRCDALSTAAAAMTTTRICAGRTGLEEQQQQQEEEEEPGTSSRCSIVAVQDVLDAAGLLPTNFAALTQSSILSGAPSSGPGSDAELIEALRTKLGEMAKGVAVCRQWVADARDTCFACNINALYKEKDRNTLVTIDELRRVMSAEMSLPFLVPEATQTKHVVESVEELVREVQLILPPALLRFTTTPAAMQACANYRLCSMQCGEKGSSYCASFVPSVEGQLRHTRQCSRYHYSPCQLELLLSSSLLSQQPVVVGEELTVAAPDIDLTAAANLPPTMEHIQSLLERAAIVPIKINEVPLIGFYYFIGCEIEKEVDAFLYRADLLSFTKSKVISDKSRPSLEAMSALHTQAAEFPFALRNIDRLSEYIHKTRIWQKEVRAMDKKRSATGGGGGSGKANSKQQQQQQQQQKDQAVPLKRVDALVAEGERLPFDVKEELEILSGKKALAKQWLERLKKSFVPTKAGSSRLRKGEEGGTASLSGNGSAATIEKPSLEDMKSMVHEGSVLYKDDAGGEDDININSSSSSSGGGTLRSRELDKAVGLVDQAEEWIERVRDMLQPGSGSGSDDSSDVGDGDDEDNDKDGDGSIKLDASSIRDLLNDVDSMPVALEEAEVLRYHLRALEWADEVRPFLSGADKKGSGDKEGEEEQAEEQQEQYADGGSIEQRKRRRNRSSKGSSVKLTKNNEKQKLTLAEMQKYAAEIKSIREKVVFHARNSCFPELAASLGEELLCLRIVEEGEVWMGRMRRIFQQSQGVKRGTKLAKVKTILEQGKSIQLLLDTELAPFQEIADACEAWLQTNSEVLKHLGLTTEHEENVDLDEDGDGVLDSTTHVSSRSISSSSSSSSSSSLSPESQVRAQVSLSELKEAVVSADHIVVEFDSLKSCRQRVTDVESWLITVANLCSIASTSNVISAEFRAALNDFCASSVVASARTASSSSGRKSSTSNHHSSSSSSNGILTYAEIDNLVTQGRSYGITLSHEIELIEQLRDHAHKWELKAATFFKEVFEPLLQQLFMYYQELVRASTIEGRPNLLNFTFIKEDSNNSSSDSGGCGTSSNSNGNRNVGPVNEPFLNKCLCTLLSQVASLKAAGCSLGVFSPAVQTAEAYHSVFRWMSNVRNFMCGAGAGAEKQREELQQQQQQKKQQLELSELPTPLSVPQRPAALQWGDISVSYIQDLIRNGEYLYAAVCTSSSSSSSSSSSFLPHSNKHTCSTTVTDDFSTDDDHEMTQPSKEKFISFTGGILSDDYIAAASSGNGSEEGDAEQQAARKRSRNSHSSDRSPFLGDSTAAAAKSTRSNFGISKAKTLGDDFQADLSTKVTAVDNLESDTATDNYTDRYAEAEAARLGTKGGKRSRNSRGSASSSSSVSGGHNDERDSKKRKTIPRPISEVVLSVVAGDSLLENYKTSDTSSTTSAAIIAKQQLCREYLAQLAEAKYVVPKGAIADLFPPELASAVELWLRGLRLMQGRALAAKQWRDSANALLSKLVLDRRAADAKAVQKLSSTVKTSGCEVQRLLEEAEKETFRCTERDILEALLDRSQTWEHDCYTFLGAAVPELLLQRDQITTKRNREKRKTEMTVEELQNFFDCGDVLFFEDIEAQTGGTGLLAALHAEIKAVHQWIERIQKADADRAGGAVTQELNDLVEASKQLKCNVSEYTEPITQLTKKYCLCRQHYHGEMIGCDFCDEWYHLHCIGLTETQVAKTEKFSCIRCSIKRSYEAAHNVALLTCQKWSIEGGCSEHFKSRKHALAKIEKRIAKELQQDYSARKNQGGTASTTDGSGVISGLDGVIYISAISNSAPSSADNTAVVNSDTVTSGKDAEATTSDKFSALVRLESDRALFIERLRQEQHKKSFIAEWMIEMKSVISPPVDGNCVLERAGRPLGADIESCNKAARKRKLPYDTGDVYGQTVHGVMHNLTTTGLLAGPVELAVQRAAVHMLDGIEDVVLVLDAFRWRSWCNLSLLALRAPPCSRVLRQLIESGRRFTTTATATATMAAGATSPPQFVDEKILKVLNHMSNKISAWKLRSRKIVENASSRGYSDAAKFYALTLEGNTIPVTSRMKSLFTAIVNKIEGVDVKDEGSGAVELISSEEVATAIANMRTPSLKGPKLKDKDQKDITIGRYLLNLSSMPVSSDEEGDDDDDDDGDDIDPNHEKLERSGSSTSSRRGAFKMLKYTSIEAAAMADVPLLPWPIR